MMIRSMTATFGKLENKTLVMEPGLNIIEAPNEWGKSTWCAFLAAMLYGLDTRAKSTKNTLADKERYQPWSGAPMAGRLEIIWQGREITIERRTKGRTPLGDFQAYETVSGLNVPELNAANCGQVLLGVEKSVFLRSAFIRQSDMRVTGDETLRRRLQALVTTGDENATGEDLAGQLRDLKNRCRYHRSGLLPQAEEERSEQEEQLSQLHRLEHAIQSLEERQAENRDRMICLEKHSAYLDYQAALADACRVRRAQREWQEAEEKLRALREKKPEKRNRGPAAVKFLVLGLLAILAGILLGMFWNVTAGILTAALGVLGICLGLAKHRQTDPGNHEQALLAEAAQNAARAREHYEAVLAMAKPMPPQAEPVGLDLNAGETTENLRAAREEQVRLESRRSQYLGRMEALGDRNTLENRLRAVNVRIEKLETTYAALTMAQETLAEATAQLQRRFAPRIAEGAADRMARLTGGRYDRLRLDEDLGLLAGAEGEQTLRDVNWRSDGTVDQLYLALRMSVAQALIPDGPLILDDALVRFDDSRLKAALALLKEEARSRQVILFTCQSREKNLLR